MPLRFFFERNASELRQQRTRQQVVFEPKRIGPGLNLVASVCRLSRSSAYCCHTDICCEVLNLGNCHPIAPFYVEKWIKQQQQQQQHRTFVLLHRQVHFGLNKVPIMANSRSESCNKQAYGQHPPPPTHSYVQFPPAAVLLI